MVRSVILKMNLTKSASAISRVPESDAPELYFSRLGVLVEQVNGAIKTPVMAIIFLGIITKVWPKNQLMDFQTIPIKISQKTVLPQSEIKCSMICKMQSRIIMIED